jgi:hypothetical protein
LNLLTIPAQSPFPPARNGQKLRAGMGAGELLTG